MVGANFFSLGVVGMKSGCIFAVFKQTNTMRYHRQSFKASQPVRHEAMMAIKPKHVKLVKYNVESFSLSQVLTVYFGRFCMRLVVAKKHANDYTTSVKFTDSATGAGCAINTNGKHICPFKTEWSGGGSPIIGYYCVGDSRVDVRIADALSESEYELIRQTIAWAWATINSGTVSFPIGDHQSVSIKPSKQTP
jgi:hypothetical protein